MIMSTGRRICPECKGNGYLKTSIGKIVQAMVRITFGQVK